MTDVETTFRTELNRLVTVDATPDWDAVAGVARAGNRRRQRLAVGAVALLGAAALALATPLGGAVARGLGDFSAWLTGEPGEPVSQRSSAPSRRKAGARGSGFPREPSSGGSSRAPGRLKSSSSASAPARAACACA